MVKKLLLAIMVLLALSGCSAIDHGYITNKAHEDDFWYTTTQCSGKPLICTPIQHYSPEHWRFDIREGEKTGWVYVTHETFDSYEVGQYFQFS